MQVELLKMQTAVCKCYKTTTVKEKGLHESKSHNSMRPPITITTKSISNSSKNDETLSIVKNNNCIITAAVSKLKLKSTDYGEILVSEQ